MVGSTLALLVSTLANVFILLVIVSALLSYFMSPYHPIRQAIDRIVEPFLAPIRRIVPTVGMLDFSPLILILLVQFLSNVIVRIINP